MSEIDIYKAIAEKEQLNNLVNVCQKEIRELKEKLKQYEDPDDLTLFYMWLDGNAKDKMKHMENEIKQLKQFNQMLTEMGEDYKSRCEKANEKIKSFNLISGFRGGKTIISKLLYDLDNILNGRSDE